MTSIALAIGAVIGLAAAKAPDTSLDTTPVAYYGANWNRSQVNIDQLAKMQMVSAAPRRNRCPEIPRLQTCDTHGAKCSGWPAVHQVVLCLLW